MRYRIYCGPTIVLGVADKLAESGYAITCVGTEHVYVETDKTPQDILNLLGPTWKPRDIIAVSGKNAL